MDKPKFYSFFIAMREGDEAAFEEVYRLTLPLVVKTVNTYLSTKLWWMKSPDERESFRDEAVNDVYFALYRHMGAIETPEALPGWLKAVAHNVCCSKTRQVKNEWLPLTEEAVDIRVHDVRSLDPEELFDHLVDGRLTGHPYWALRLYAVDGFSYEEIASLMKVPVGTVKSRIKTARSTLAA